VDGDLSLRPRAPGQVQLAIYLVATSCLAATARAILMKDWSRPISATIGLAILAAICVLWIYGLYQARNWLRWVTVLFFAVHLAATPWALASLHDTREDTMYWIQCLSGVLAAMLLCMPNARRWFTLRSVS
jgi:hypothetical protein